LKERVNFAPANLTYKVYIIDEVHMLTKEAFNALLKTLEEPPSHIIFILATTEIEKVPITILSRSQRFDFKLASQDEISQKVKLILEGESRTMADEAISLLVELGRGSFRDTETILEKILNTLENPKKEIGLENIEEVLGIASYSQIEELAEAISNKSQVKVFGIVKSIEESGINPKYVINQLLENFRKRLLRRVIEKSGDLSASELAFIVSAFVEAFSQIRFSPIEILPLEVALVNIFDKIGTSTDIISVSKPEKEISSPKEFKQKIKSTKEVLPEREESEEQKNSDKKSEISVFELKSKWEDLLNEIKPYNHHLVAFLSKAEPLSVENNSIQIKVAYKFHKDRIENQKSKDAINKVTGIVYGKEYSFECILDENMKSTEMKDGFSEDTNEELVEEIFKE
jgi:DNA polymerase-3 subunit gamma/tau